MLKYIYACMSAGKTTELLKTYDQFVRKGLCPVIAKPNVDDREGKVYGWGTTASKIITRPIPAYYFQNIDEVKKLEFGVLLLDEVQFMNPNEVVKLTEFKTDVYAYGLKTDVNANLFPASAKILAIADEIREISMLCQNPDCKNKAVVHSRYIDGKIDKSGKSVVIEKGQISYKSLCFDCWKKERD